MPARWSATALLQRLLARAFPGRDQQALHNSLLKALPDLVSGMPRAEAVGSVADGSRRRGPARAVRSTAGGRRARRRSATNPQFRTFRDALDDFLEDWGFRCSGGADADGAELPGGRRAAHRSAEGLCRDGRRVARRHPRAPGARTRSRDARACSRRSAAGRCRRSCHSSASRSSSAPCCAGRSGRSSCGSARG